MGARPRGHRTWACLLALVAVIGARAAAGSRAELTLSGDGDSTLLEGLLDNDVATIVLATDYSVAKELPGTPAAPFRLDRNVTIKGVWGPNGPTTTLDLAFRRAVIVLCGTCQVTFRDLTLANARRGNGAALDFFVGEEDTTTNAVIMRRVYRQRLACTPASDATEVIEHTKRSAALPNATRAQVYDVRDVTYMGVAHPHSLHLTDFTEKLELVHLEGRGHNAGAHFGGYSLGAYDVTYLCSYYTPEACLAEKSPDACVSDLIDSVLAGAAGGSRGPPIGAIVGPIVAVAVLLAALAAWLCVRRRRRRRAAAAQEQLRRDKSGAASDGGIVAPQVIVCGGDDSAMALRHTKSTNGRRSLELAMQPSGGRLGWQLVSSCTTSFIDTPVDDETVEFGPLLGSGSFGRVYRARWGGRDVAAKVIEHDRSTLAAVEAEAALMLSFNHRNVVRAFHYATYTYIEPAHSERGSSCVTGRNRTFGSGARGSAGSSGSRGSGGSSGMGAPAPRSQSFLLAKRSMASAQSGSGHSVSPQLPPLAPGSTLASLHSLAHRGAAARQESGSFESPDALVTNLSFGAESACEAAAAAAVLDAKSSSCAATIAGSGIKGSVATKSGHSGSPHANSFAFPSTDGTLSAGGAVVHKAETWLIQEYCDMGTLGAIAGSWEPTQECDAQMLERLLLLRDTAHGLQLLHDNSVVHGDLNARNVLVSSDASVECGLVAKVADLGLSRVLAHHATHRTTNSCGTMSHMAPELLRFGRMSAACDVYAFGIMMWELYSGGHAAFDKLHYGQFFEIVVLRSLRPMIPQGCPCDYELLMRQCWAAEPTERPTVATLLEALDVMIADRQQRVEQQQQQQQQQLDPGARAPVQLPPPSSATMPALLALLRVQQPRPSCEQAPQPPPPAELQQQQQQQLAGLAPATAAVAPSSPSSAASLSGLFVETSSPVRSDVLPGAGQPPPAAPWPRAAIAAAAVVGTGSPVGTPASGSTPLGGNTPLASGSLVAGQHDLETALGEDASAHGGRTWFV